MKTRPLARTGLELTELSFGAAGIGNLYRRVSREDAMAVLNAAWDGGIRYFDTAPYYGQGLSERRLGDFLRGKPRGEFILSTKVGRLLRPVPEAETPDNGFVDALPFAVDYDYSYDGIMRSVEFSLARLGLNRIDILYVHDLEPGTLGPEAYRRHLDVFANDGARALAELKAKGAIGAFGIGVNEVSACLDVMEHVDLDCILLAGRYTLLDRTAEDRLLALCEERSTALVIGGVFNSGILATGPVPGATFDYVEASPSIRERVAEMEAVAMGSGVPLAAAAMRFPLRHDSVASVLIGTGKASSMTRNLDQFAMNVPDAVWPVMDRIVIGGGDVG
ncbi:aldo/keto reductase [Fulvimarina endophytica]|uniref:Aldo/keto reductase n=1 Tax=Fulvimarina endophytica TaxID=2293836 RepID=A0A371WYD4_9HYPH|nr:aldo/keto reductase [Fulvimarina endophytica]RFC62000.1 aldo/keto reductase [Fulvimarina endophytica]